MFNKESYIGTDKHGEIFCQEIKDGAIRGFYGYIVVELQDCTEVLQNVSWTHEVTIGKKTIKTGDAPGKVKPLPSRLKDLYEADTVSCDECNATYDSENINYPDTCEFVYLECAAMCKSCVKAADLLIEVKNPKDIFSARSMIDVDTTGYTEVETLFCDSSGFGTSRERALTKNQAIETVKKLLKGKRKLYAGLTGIGQFQVYVTLYRKGK